MRRQLTYANVVSTVCLVLLLGGGTALANVLITKNGQVDRGTISGHKPPSGDHPNIIGGSVAGADLSTKLKASLRLHCPSGLRQAGDICFEDSIRPAATLADALKTCASAGRRLPSLAELTLVFDHLGAPLDAEWVATEFWDDNGHFVAKEGALVGEDQARRLDLSADDSSLHYHYRCVTSATN